MARYENAELTIEEAQAIGCAIALEDLGAPPLLSLTKIKNLFWMAQPLAPTKECRGFYIPLWPEAQEGPEARA